MKVVTLNLNAPLGNSPPTEFKIFDAGLNSTLIGPIVFDEIAAELVMASAARHFVAGEQAVMIDLEHLSTDKFSPSFDPDARGWADLELRDGELWAVNVKWTEDGTARITSKRQRFTSPAVITDLDNNILRLRNIALVAAQAIDSQTPLIAASERNGKTMKAKLLKALGLSDDASDDLILKTLSEQTTPKPAEITDEARAELKDIREIALAVRDATGKETAGEIAATMTAWKSNGASSSDANEQLVALSARQDRFEMDRLIEANKDKLSGPKEDEYARSLKTPSELTAYFSAKAPVKRQPVGEPEVKPEEKTVTLSDADKIWGAISGIDAEKKLKFKERIVKEKAEREEVNRLRNAHY